MFMLVQNRVLNRVYVPDDRDYPVISLLGASPTTLTEKFWWDDGWWGNQGETSECTAYSWTHWMEDNALNQPLLESLSHPLWNVDAFYTKLQKNDGIAGVGYDGSTVRAGAKVLRELNILEEYRWAKTIDEMSQSILTIGPVVCGTSWYQGMFSPNSAGFIRPTGGIAGGHAYVINGVDTVKKYFRIKNSWGRDYGVNGHAYISFDDFATLMYMNGDVCVPIANKLTTIPAFNTVTDTDTPTDPTTPSVTPALGQ